MSEPDWELPDVAPFAYPADTSPLGEWHGPPTGPPLPGSRPGLDVDGGILIYPAAGADEPPVWVFIPPPKGFGAADLSATLSLIPVIGTVKDLAEGIAGVDLITGKDISNAQRALNFLSVAADLLTFGEGGREIKAGELAVKELPTAVRVLKAVGKGAGHVNDVQDVNTILDVF